MRKGLRGKSALVAVAVAALVAIGCGGSSGSGLFVGDGGGGQDGANPAGCPASIPRSGAACVLADGTHCGYGCDQGGPATATCSGQRWSVAQLAISCEVPDAGDAGPPPAPAPFACGSTTCGVTQYCVEPCCGGVAPPCLPLPDSGDCPAGTHPGTCQFGGGGPGCVGNPCTPPPPYCVESPSQAPPYCDPFPNSSKPRDLACTCA